MQPKISIIITSYNCEEYIARALESAFAQTYSNLEIILVDDASDDSTLEIARSFDDPRLKIIANQQNRGVSSARNCGLRAATGDWIALLDSDDWYAPLRLEKLVEIALQQNADLVADDLFLIRDRDRYPWSTLLQENQLQTKAIELVDAAKFVITDRPSPINSPRNWSFGYTKPLISRKFLLEHGIKYDESIDVGEDFILYLECLQNKGRFLMVPQPYYYYRVRQASLSVRRPTEYLAQSCQITQRFIDREEAAEIPDRWLLETMYQNLKIFRKRFLYYRAIEQIRAKKVLSTSFCIIKCPYISIYFINKLITILEHKTLAISPRKESEYANLTFE